MPSDNDILDTAKLIRLTGKEIARKRDSNASSLGLTSAQADALTFIEDNPGCSISDLSENMGATHQAARAIADRMRTNGLIDISVSESDGRVRNLGLTHKGRMVLDEFLRMGVDVNRELFGNLSDAEMSELHRLLTSVRDHLRWPITAPSSVATI